MMKFVYGGLGAMFLLFAANNLLHGELANGAAGVAIGVLLVGVAFYVPAQARAAEDFRAWVLEHAGPLQNGAPLTYQGHAVTAATEVTQFSTCISVVLLTHQFPSRYLIRHSSQATVTRSAYTIVSLLLGWWGIPFGPIYTVQAVYRNLRGGHVQTLGQMLAARLAEQADVATEAEADRRREEQAEREGRRLRG